MTDIDDYRNAAEMYRPDSIRVLFVAESPPAFSDEARRSYFFFVPNPGRDILFATLVKAVLDEDYRKGDGNKGDLLCRFQSEGYWLMDAVEYPINRAGGRRMSDSERAPVIRANVPRFLARLDRLRNDGVLLPSAGIILIKKLVFEVLRDPLAAAGHRVLHSRKIDFPKYYRDSDTIRGIREALEALRPGE